MTSEVALLNKSCIALLKQLRAAGHLSTGAHVDSFIEMAAKDFMDELFDHFDESHRAPLQRVIGNLPVPELAELAEALVFMESMKERVTATTESVSGPIKRKHYFDPKLNPRFFKRYGNA